MPQYTVESPDGRQVTVEGDSAPTEKDLDQIFASLPPKGNTDQATGKEMEGSRDANGIYSGPSLIMRTSAGNREWLRSLGKEDGADAYMRGLDNPSKSETFQSQMLRTGMIPQENAGVLNRFAGGVTGELADMVTSPVQSLMLALGDIQMSKASSAFKSVLKGDAGPALAEAKAGIGKVISLLSKDGKLPPPAEVSGMIEQAGQEASDFGKVIDRTQAADVATSNTKFANLKSAKTQELNNFVETTIPEIADKTTLANRENYLDLSKDISTRFGKAYNDAIGDATINIEDVHSALGNAIERAGLLEKPEPSWSPSEKKIMDYYKRLGENLPSTEPTLRTDPLLGTVSVPPTPVELPVAKVDTDLQRILQSRAGQKYGPGDHILTLAREEMTNVMPENDKIRIVRAKFKPLLQMKNEAHAIFQPFNKSGEFDTTRGINFFSRYANGALKPDEVRFVNAMKQKFGKDVFSDVEAATAKKADLGKQLAQLDSDHQGELAGIQSAHDEVRAKTQMDTENHVSMLEALLQNSLKDEETGALIKKLTLGGAKLVGGGALAGAGFKTGEMLGNLIAKQG